MFHYDISVYGNMSNFSGRKTNCFIYGVLYGGACITKHFANFNILMVGRLLGGISTSILFSAFESWLVYEHTNVIIEDCFFLQILVRKTEMKIISAWFRRRPFEYGFFPCRLGEFCRCDYRGGCCSVCC